MGVEVPVLRPSDSSEPVAMRLTSCVVAKRKFWTEGEGEMLSMVTCCTVEAGKC